MSLAGAEIKWAVGLSKSWQNDKDELCGNE